MFLIGAEEELLPHARTMTTRSTDIQSVRSEVVGETTDINSADISEERRLAYVGITRAKQRLYMTRACWRVKHGKQVPRTPSRFLLEIPEELIDERDIQSELTAPAETEEVRDFFKNFSKAINSQACRS